VAAVQYTFTHKQYTERHKTNNTQNNTMKQNTQNGTYIRIRIHSLQNPTEAYKTHNYIYNYKKWNQKNMKECDKRKSHVSSKLHMYIF